MKMKKLLKAIGFGILRLVSLALLGGFFCATLVRFGPGFGVDERELDPRLSRESVRQIRQENQINSDLLSYYAQYLGKAVRGDFGKSRWLGQPVSSLIKERFGVTARSVAFGLVWAWTLALTLALSGIFFRNFFFDFSNTLLSGILIALPTAVVAILAVYFRAPVSAAIAIAAFPKLFRYLRNLFVHAFDQPYIMAARARGIGDARLIFRQVLPQSAPSVFALLGISLSLAFGAAIPIEALCDSPGIGQLAWQAALNRDLPLITSLTLIVTLITVGANSFANLKQENSL
jgi:peptide/nickel transport system permease protein